MLSTEKLHVIEKYFSGQNLSSEEQNSFNSWQENDSEFIKELNFRRSLKNSLFRKNVRDTGEKEFSRLKSIKLLKVCLIATLGIALIASTFYLLSNQRERFLSHSINETLEEFAIDAKLLI